MKTLVTVWSKELRELLFTPECRSMLESVSELDWVEEGVPYAPERLKQDIGGYDAVITSWGSPKLTAEALERAERLKFVGHAAGSLVPYIDPELFRKEITVVNANSALARSTAECAVALMMSASWRLPHYHDRLREDRWRNNDETVMGLYGQSIGIVGIGEVAREVIRLLRVFNPTIRLHSPYCTPEEARELGVELASLHDVLAGSRIVSLHDTLTESTRGMIGRKELALLPDGALLVNTARAGLIDEQALLEELSGGRISAALDVYHREPPEPGNPLTRLPNVLCVPHIGAFSRYWKPRMGVMVAEDLRRFAEGLPPLRRITEERFVRMTRQ